MSGEIPSVTSAPAPPTSSPVPWWAHILIGALILAAGVALEFAGNANAANLAPQLIGGGLALLGVGAGVAASS